MENNQNKSANFNINEIKFAIPKVSLFNSISKVLKLDNKNIKFKHPAVAVSSVLCVNNKNILLNYQKFLDVRHV